MQALCCVGWNECRKTPINVHVKFGSTGSARALVVKHRLQKAARKARALSTTGEWLCNTSRAKLDDRSIHVDNCSIKYQVKGQGQGTKVSNSMVLKTMML